MMYQRLDEKSIGSTASYVVKIVLCSYNEPLVMPKNLRAKMEEGWKYPLLSLKFENISSCRICRDYKTKARKGEMKNEDRNVDQMCQMCG